MKTIEETTKWLLENRKDTNGDLNLIGLDLSNFDGDVYICNMKVKKSLHQDYQKVGKSLFQDSQEVGESLFQNNQKVGENLYQSSQEVDKNLYQAFQKVGSVLYQDNQKVKENLFQSNQTVGKNFYNHKLKEDEYWKEEESCVVRKKKLKTITRKQLEEMGYKLEDDNYEI